MATLNVLPTDTAAAKSLGAPSLAELVATWNLELDAHGDTLTVQQAYAVNAWMRRCVLVRANAALRVEWAIHSGDPETPLWDGSGDPPEPIAYAANLRLLKFLMASSEALMGRAYILKEQTAGRRGLDGLKWLNPASIREEISERDGLRYFEHTKLRDRYAPEDVIYLWSPDPFREIGAGSADGDAARIHADVLHSIYTFLDNYFDRGLIKATLLAVSGSVSPEERSRFEKWWNKYFRGAKRAGNQKLINADKVQPITIGEGLRDLSNEVLTEEHRESIAAAFGVPYTLVKSNAANYATADVEWTRFYADTVIPSLELVEDALNRHWLHDLGLEIQHFPERLEVMQARKLEWGERLSKLTGGKAVMTQNEARGFLGLEPREEPEADDLTRPVPTALTGHGTFGGDGAPAMLSEEKRLDLVRWRRKATKHGPDVTFSPDALTTDEAAAVKARLTAGLDFDDAFRPPLVNF